MGACISNEFCVDPGELEIKVGLKRYQYLTDNDLVVFLIVLFYEFYKFLKAFLRAKHRII